MLFDDDIGKFLASNLSEKELTEISKMYGIRMKHPLDFAFPDPMDVATSKKIFERALNNLTNPAKGKSGPPYRVIACLIISALLSPAKLSFASHYATSFQLIIWTPILDPKPEVRQAGYQVVRSVFKCIQAMNKLDTQPHINVILKTLTNLYKRRDRKKHETHGALLVTKELFRWQHPPHLLLNQSHVLTEVVLSHCQSKHGFVREEVLCILPIIAKFYADNDLVQPYNFLNHVLNFILSSLRSGNLTRSKMLNALGDIAMTVGEEIGAFVKIIIDDAILSSLPVPGSSSTFSTQSINDALLCLSKLSVACPIALNKNKLMFRGILNTIFHTPFSYELVSTLANIASHMPPHLHFIQINLLNVISVTLCGVLLKFVHTDIVDSEEIQSQWDVEANRSGRESKRRRALREVRAGISLDHPSKVHGPSPIISTPGGTGTPLPLSSSSLSLLSGGTGGAHDSSAVSVSSRSSGSHDDIFTPGGSMLGRPRRSSLSSRWSGSSVTFGSGSKLSNSERVRRKAIEQGERRRKERVKKELEKMHGKDSTASPTLSDSRAKTSGNASSSSSSSSTSASVASSSSTIKPSKNQQLVATLDSSLKSQQGFLSDGRTRDLCIFSDISSLSTLVKNATASHTSSQLQTHTKMIILALQTLTQFPFNHSVSLTDFCADVVVTYLDHPNPLIRQLAAQACLRLAVRKGKETPTVGYQSLLVSEILARVLIVGVSDLCVHVREKIITALSQRYDALLAQEELLSTLVTGLQDENTNVRAWVIFVCGRLLHHNPTHIIPPLRRLVMFVLNEIELASSMSAKTNAAKLLGIITSSAPSVVQPYLQVVLSTLPSVIPASFSSSHLTPVQQREEEALVVAVTQCIEIICKTCDMEIVLLHFIPSVVPYLISLLRDKANKPHKKIHALKTLTAVFECIGTATEPYVQFSHLLPLLLAILKRETSPHIKSEILRLLGTLGALSPVAVQRLEEGEDFSTSRAVLSAGGFSVDLSAIVEQVGSGDGAVFLTQHSLTRSAADDAERRRGRGQNSHGGATSSSYSASSSRSPSDPTLNPSLLSSTPPFSSSTSHITDRVNEIQDLMIQGVLTGVNTRGRGDTESGSRCGLRMAPLRENIRVQREGRRNYEDKILKSGKHHDLTIAQEVAQSKHKQYIPEHQRRIADRPATLIDISAEDEDYVPLIHPHTRSLLFYNRNRETQLLRRIKDDNPQEVAPLTNPSLVGDTNIHSDVLHSVLAVLSDASLYPFHTSAVECVGALVCVMDENNLKHHMTELLDKIGEMLKGGRRTDIEEQPAQIGEKKGSKNANATSTGANSSSSPSLTISLFDCFTLIVHTTKHAVRPHLEWLFECTTNYWPSVEHAADLSSSSKLLELYHLLAFVEEISVSIADDFRMVLPWVLPRLLGVINVDRVCAGIVTSHGKSASTHAHSFAAAQAVLKTIRVIGVHLGEYVHIVLSNVIDEVSIVPGRLSNTSLRLEALYTTEYLVRALNLSQYVSRITVPICRMLDSCVCVTKGRFMIQGSGYSSSGSVSGASSTWGGFDSSAQTVEDDRLIQMSSNKMFNFGHDYSTSCAPSSAKPISPSDLHLLGINQVRLNKLVAAGINVLFALMQRVGVPFSIFIPTVNSVMVRVKEAFSVSAVMWRYERCVEKILREEHVKNTGPSCSAAGFPQIFGALNLVNPVTSSSFLSSPAASVVSVCIGGEYGDEDQDEAGVISNGIRVRVGEGGYINLSQPHLKEMVQVNWNVETCTTVHDWHSWFNQLSLTLLASSPSLALRAVSNLARFPDTHLSRSLFQISFTILYKYNDKRVQTLLLAHVMRVLQSDNIPPEYRQLLLDLIEHLERECVITKYKFKMLSELSLKCYAYAKALHYQEACFDQEPNIQMGERLIHTFTQLGQRSAAVGVLALLQRKYKDVGSFTTHTEKWFEKLGAWDNALVQYNKHIGSLLEEGSGMTGVDISKKSTDGETSQTTGIKEKNKSSAEGKHPLPASMSPLGSSIDASVSTPDLGSGKTPVPLCFTHYQSTRLLPLLMGRLRCLEGLGLWKEALATTQDALALPHSPSHHTELALHGAHCAFNVSDWSTLSLYTPHIPSNTVQGMFYRCVCAVCLGNYQSALKLIQRTRSMLEMRICGVLSESYNRSYGDLVINQQLVELEEIIEFNVHSQHARNERDMDLDGGEEEVVLKRRKRLERVWEQRLIGCERNTNVWTQLLSVRQLLDVGEPTIGVDSPLAQGDSERHAERVSPKIEEIASTTDLHSTANLSRTDSSPANLVPSTSLTTFENTPTSISSPGMSIASSLTSPGSNLSVHSHTIDTEQYIPWIAFSSLSRQDGKEKLARNILIHLIGEEPWAKSYEGERYLLENGGRIVSPSCTRGGGSTCDSGSLHRSSPHLSLSATPSPSPPPTFMFCHPLGAPMPFATHRHTALVAYCNHLWEVGERWMGYELLHGLIVSGGKSERVEEVRSEVVDFFMNNVKVVKEQIDDEAPSDDTFLPTFDVPPLAPSLPSASTMISPRGNAEERRGTLDGRIFYNQAEMEDEDILSIHGSDQQVSNQ
ncbi:Serine/threonine-protein kinase Tor, partial [Aduncisulcus paluster]